jgi:hypothetical protein
MRKVIVSAAVREKIDELELFLKNELRLSKTAATQRCDRIDAFLKSLSAPGDYALCRYLRWREAGYRCVPFEKTWVFAYEIVPEGVIVRDMSHASALHDD